MSTNKILIAALVGGVASFIGGFLIYGLALEGFMKSQAGSATGVTREPMDMITMILGNLGFGALFALIFGRWAGIKTLATGAIAGALIGLLMAFSYDMMIYSTTNLMKMGGVIADIIAAGVVSAITGGVVGFMLGRGEARA